MIVAILKLTGFIFILILINVLTDQLLVKKIRDIKIFTGWNDLAKLFSKNTVLPIGVSPAPYIIMPVLAFTCLFFTMCLLALVFTGFFSIKVNILFLYVMLFSSVIYSQYAAVVSLNPIAIFEALKLQNSLYMDVFALISCALVAVLRTKSLYMNSAVYSGLPVIISAGGIMAFAVYMLVSEDLLSSFPGSKHNAIVNSDKFIEYSGPLLGLWLVNGQLLKTCLALYAVVLFFNGANLSYIYVILSYILVMLLLYAGSGFRKTVVTRRAFSAYQILIAAATLIALLFALIGI